MRVLRRRARRRRGVEIGAFSLPDLPGLTTLVDDHLPRAFPGWSAGPTLLNETLARPIGRLPLSEYERLQNGCLLCARVEERVVGAMYLCRVPPRADPHGETPPGTAHLAWIFFYPGQPEVGELLLRRALIRAGAWRCHRVRAWELGLAGLTSLGVGGLSASWPHLEAPLRNAGFRATRETVLWTGEPADAPPPAGITVRVETTARGWHARAFAGAEPVGECRGVPVSSYCAHAAAANITLIEGLMVEARWRQRGIGTALVGAIGQAAGEAGRLMAAALPAGDLAASRLARRLAWSITDRLRAYER